MWVPNFNKKLIFHKVNESMNQVYHNTESLGEVEGHGMDAEGEASKTYPPRTGTRVVVIATSWATWWASLLPLCTIPLPF